MLVLELVDGVSAQRWEGRSREALLWAGDVSLVPIGFSIEWSWRNSFGPFSYMARSSVNSEARESELSSRGRA
jgi:hypothetical protein